jgi:hypothetical protein
MIGGLWERGVFLRKKRVAGKKQSCHRLVRSQDGRDRWREREGNEAEGKRQRDDQTLKPPGRPIYHQILKPPGAHSPSPKDPLPKDPLSPCRCQYLRVSKVVTSGQAYVYIGRGCLHRCILEVVGRADRGHENLHPACPQGLALL